MIEEKIAQTQRATPRRILVVEDDPSIRQLNAAGLIRAGYRVDTVEDGSAGWQALQSEHYDLLITDNSMPKVTGLQLLERLHSARIFLPVIMATGTVPTEEFAQNPWLEPAATLLKPYSFQALVSKVKDILPG